jgi:hypothetical protein
MIEIPRFRTGPAVEIEALGSVDAEPRRSLTMNRLDTIAARQKKTRSHDLLFACLVALASTISVTTVSAAAQAAQVARH